MVKNLPAMGWNTWNTFMENISEELILETANIMVSSGLKDAGYEYIVVDDCWSKKERDKNGKLVEDEIKFPHGIKYVIDKVHDVGLKFGMYSCAGTVTCAGYPGSYEFEFIDAKTFAEWGVDYLKYDFCFHSTGMSSDLLYKKMGIALANCGREILFSACSWGADETHEWIKQTGANSWRSTGDILDSWTSIKNIFLQQIKRQPYVGKGCFDDYDMLVVGMNGKGQIGKTGCTYNEYFTHMAIWCFFASPLMIGKDIRELDEETKKILMNKDLIRINQDNKCSQPFLINMKLHNFDENYGVYVFAKYLDNGDIAILAVNMLDDSCSKWQYYFNTESVGVPLSSKKTLILRDVITDKKEYLKNGSFQGVLKAHQAQVFIARVVDLDYEM